MGTCFQLYKRKPKERYYLGKVSREEGAWEAMWSIMDSPNYKAFRLNPHDAENLANKLLHGSFLITTKDEALMVAYSIIEWAGCSELVLVPDNDEPPFKKLGWDTKGYRTTGHFYHLLL